MCVMSMIGDHYSDRFRKQWPDVVQWPVVTPPAISREEFDKLREQVDEMMVLLKRAKKYDEDHGEPDCEMDEKLALLRKVAELVGVDLEEALA